MCKTYKVSVFRLFLSQIQLIIMQTGTVKFFNTTKGFGFIKDDDTGTEYFVHVSGLVNQVKEGDQVSFELREGKKGLNAVNVRLA